MAANLPLLKLSSEDDDVEYAIIQCASLGETQYRLYFGFLFFQSYSTI